MKLQSAEAALIWSRCWGTKVDRSPGSGRDSGGVMEQTRPHKASFQTAPTAARKGPFSKSGSPTSPSHPTTLRGRGRTCSQRMEEFPQAPRGGVNTRQKVTGKKEETLSKDFFFFEKLKQ